MSAPCECRSHRFDVIAPDHQLTRTTAPPSRQQQQASTNAMRSRQTTLTEREVEVTEVIPTTKETANRRRHNRAGAKENPANAPGRKFADKEGAATSWVFKPRSCRQLGSDSRHHGDKHQDRMMTLIERGEEVWIFTGGRLPPARHY